MKDAAPSRVKRDLAENAGKPDQVFLVLVIAIYILRFDVKCLEWLFRSIGILISCPVNIDFCQFLFQTRQHLKYQAPLL